MKEHRTLHEPEELLVLVDEEDRPVGTATKLAAHRDGTLHRAVSIVLVDDAGRVLLQQRASAKYHSGGLWSNTCCGHPRPAESVVDAAKRRLRAELGITDATLSLAGSFRYRAPLSNGFVEHELDHVLVGCWSGIPAPDPTEVAAIRWVSPRQLATELKTHPERFTVWMPQVFAALSER